MTQRVTLLVIVGQAASRALALVGTWGSTTDSATKFAVDRLAESLKAHSHEPAVLHFCEWIDTWLTGMDLEGLNAAIGSRYHISVFTPNEAAEWASSLLRQFPEQLQLAARLQEAAAAWAPAGHQAIVLLLREVLEGSRTDEDAAAAAANLPAWLNVPIYLDNHATTRVDPRVVAAMLPFLSEQYGNPASTNHSFGAAAAAAVAQARQQVATLLGASPREILFTSGATEANNLALKGVAAAYRTKGDHFVSVVTEHPAVLDPLERLRRDGATVTLLPVDPHGLVTPAQVEAALTDRTLLISVMAANNEIGTLQPLAEIGRLCKGRGVLFHVDAAQAVGKLPLDMDELGIDLLSLSAHKLYGPKGVGALFVRRRDPRVRLEALFDGGGQEHNLRSGTLNVPGIVGLGLACELAGQEMAEEVRRLRALRDRLWEGLRRRVPQVHLNGPPLAERLPGNLNVSFTYVQGEALLLALKDIAVSSGSACTTLSQEPSHVLRAIGLPDDLADASLRFGLGRFTTHEEIDHVIDQVAQAVAKLRELSSAWKPPT